MPPTAKRHMPARTRGRSGAHTGTGKEAEAEAEPHVARRRVEDGGARGADDAAKDVCAQGELVLRALGSL